MAETTDARTMAISEDASRTKNSVMATSVISAHGLEHMYGHGFLALIPAIYDSLGLVPVQASLFPAVRTLPSTTVWTPSFSPISLTS